MKEHRIQKFLHEQSVIAHLRAPAYLYSKNGTKRPHRALYSQIHTTLMEFLDTPNHNHWFIVSGVRGSGKTTLFFQLQDSLQHANCEMLSISCDYSFSILQLSLTAILWAFKRKDSTRPLVVFIDETQKDPHWNDAIQDFLDNNKHIFIVIMGTPALLNAKKLDHIPHIQYLKLDGVNLTEYLKITQSKHQIKWLGDSIRDAIFHSKNSRELYASLEKIAPEVNTYYKSLTTKDLYKYILYGTMPYLLDSDNEFIAYENSHKALDQILYHDLSSSKFHPDTVALIPHILYSLAHSDTCNIKQLSEQFDLSRLKMSEIFDTLEIAGLLVRLYPYWPYLDQVVSRKSSKYLFCSPLFRVLMYRSISDIVSDKLLLSRIIEDIVSMYLYSEFNLIQKWSLSHDDRGGWANFIISIDEKTIVMDVWGTWSGYHEVHKTMKKFPSQYGIIISDHELSHDKKAGIVKIPLRMFLLM
jgi:predicted AAA+ superfamily ATPase